MKGMTRKEKLESIKYEKHYIFRGGILQYKLITDAQYKEVEKAFDRVKYYDMLCQEMFYLCRELTNMGYSAHYFEIKPDFVFPITDKNEY